MPISESFLDELISRIDIQELVSGYVRLTKKSGSNMFGLCPFHSEKTPSFSVNAEKQMYHCFGCGKGGSAITFIREVENLPFRDAVEVLAKRAGMTMPEEDGRAEFTIRRKRILELNRDAAKFFYQMLASPLGQRARDYLTERGITKLSVTKFGIGAAPNDWGLLLDAMTKKGYSQRELMDAGLCRQGQRGGSVYDFFRDRLIFPVIDVRGDVIAFSGRALDREAKSYKYLNSPDTIAFSKGKNLFGLNIAKRSKANMLILVEGNIDVVMLHQAGFDNAVAPLGTAFTAEQARLLAQYASMIAIAFDSDESGKRAVLKALPLIEATGKNVKVIDLGTAGDPDEFIKKRGADAFRTLLERGENHIGYRLQTILRDNDVSTDEGRLGYIAAAAEYLTEIASIPEREVYSAKVAQTANVSVESVKNEINRRIKRKQKRGKSDSYKVATSPRTTVQPTSRDLRYSNEASAVAEEGLIRCLIRDPGLMKIVRELGFSKDEFTSEYLAKIYAAIEARLSADKDLNQALIMSELEPGEASHLTAIMQKPEALSSSETTIKEYIKRIKIERYRHSDVDTSMLTELQKQKIEA